MLVKHPRGLPKDLEEGFELLDDGQGAGWDLAAQLVRGGGHGGEGVGGKAGGSRGGGGGCSCMLK
jgi:hypothetical protein